MISGQYVSMSYNCMIMTKTYNYVMLKDSGVDVWYLYLYRDDCNNSHECVCWNTSGYIFGWGSSALGITSGAYRSRRPMDRISPFSVTKANDELKFDLSHHLIYFLRVFGILLG